MFRKADELIEGLRQGRDLTQSWLCVDMDAFFAAVEELEDPTLVSTCFKRLLAMEWISERASHGCRQCIYDLDCKLRSKVE